MIHWRGLVTISSLDTYVMLIVMLDIVLLKGMNKLFVSKKGLYDHSQTRRFGEKHPRK